MSKAIDKSNFGYLGQEYQYRLVKCFIEEPHFFVETSKIVEPNAFTEPSLRRFVGTLVDYYEKENNVPSYGIMKTRLLSKATSEIEQTEWCELIEKLKSTSTEDWEFTKDNALKFFKQQSLIKAAKKMLEKASSGDVENYEECQKILEDALMAGGSDDYGHTIYDMLEPALSSDYTVSIPTGIDKLDEALGGGLDKGKMGLIICSLGVGKTTLSCALASNAAVAKSEANGYKGWKTLQIYFEDDDVDIARKHISKISGVESCQIRRCDEDMRERISTLLNNNENKEMYKSNIRLLKKRTGEITAADVRKEIIKFTNAGFKPDLVIIDYFECLAPEKGGFQNDSEWTREGKSMRTLENIAHDLNVAIWLPTQGTKDSIGLDLLDVDKAGGSIKKGQVAQVILTVGKTIEQAQNNRATMALQKNRAGRSKKIMRDILFDNGTCTIGCDEATSYDDNLTWKEESTKMEESNRIMMQRLAVAKSRETTFSAPEK